MVVRKKKSKEKDETKVMSRHDLDHALTDPMDNDADNQSPDVGKKVTTRKEILIDEMRSSLAGAVLKHLYEIPTDSMEGHERAFVDLLKSRDVVPDELNPKFLSIAAAIIKRYPK